MIWQQLSLAALVIAAVLVFYFRWRQKSGDHGFRSERLEGAGIQDTETQDGRSSAGSDIPEFSAFALDFFLAGVGAVVALRLTNFLGVREIGAGTVVPILFAVVLLTIVFCCMFLWLFRARSLRQKFLGYAAIAAMFLLDACGDG